MPLLRDPYGGMDDGVEPSVRRFPHRALLLPVWLQVQRGGRGRAALVAMTRSPALRWPYPLPNREFRDD